MARQRPTRLVMGPCIVEIDRIVKREVQYQLEVNRCRNKEIIVKGNYGCAWPMWAGRPSIDCIVIREVQYQFEVNRCRNEEIIIKGNFGCAWPMWAGRPRAGNGAMHKVQYQFEVNRCRNEEIIVKSNFGCAWPMWAGRPRAEVQYQFEVNRCRNEEIIVKSNFGWAWTMWAGRPRIDRIVIREFQGSSANSVGDNRGMDGRTYRQTDRQTAEITTISTRFSKSVGIINAHCTHVPFTQINTIQHY
ncbi:hypothetical protein DPMN_188603 [Dreissena polymorpha]|uniref:Uncharacterized protein n=1 Tax=Dreissena polymorpha TaxID=45954 RepID=A0A9D4DU37_DREPO|nr:hypothetical protein DPMN_188603 [Dreissena polymorpha]